MRILLALSLLILSLSINAEEIQPFTSDGCSAFPDGTFTQNELWLSCCTAHDYAYWQGGTYDERLIADQAHIPIGLNFFPTQSCISELITSKID